MAIKRSLRIWEYKYFINLYSQTSGSKERNIQTYKHGDIPLLIANAILSRQWLCP